MPKKPIAEPTQSENAPLEVSQTLAHVKVLVPHSGPHGSFVKGDTPIMERSVALELARCGYAEVLSTATELETATPKEAVEKR